MLRFEKHCIAYIALAFVLQFGAVVGALAQDYRSYNSQPSALKQMQDSMNVMRHSLSNHECELKQFEEKFSSIESIVDGLRRQFNDQSKGNKEQFSLSKTTLDAKMSDLDVVSKSFVADLKQMKECVNDTASQLFQCKQQLANFEKQMLAQNKNIESLQNAMKALMDALQSGEENSGQESIYEVKAGDSLEKIARLNGTTVRALKEKNNLADNNRIRIGQKLKIPTK